MINTIYYLIHFDNRKRSRSVTPSAITKGSYIASSLAKYCNKLEIISFAPPKRGININKSYNIGNNISCMLFGGLILPFGIAYNFLKKRFYDRIKKYLSKTLKDGDIVVAYHSLDSLDVISFLKEGIRAKIILIYEVEEIYSDIFNDELSRKSEIRVISLADAFIFPSEVIDKKINIHKRLSLISYGTYCVQKKISDKRKDGKVHCVFAGTFQLTKGADFAVQVAKFLDERYHVHIVGFGSNNDRKRILGNISKVSQETKCTITYDGLLLGNDYIKFIQSCDIGLCTQNIDAKYNDTSFPSKILSYLSNGLDVVSIRMQSVEQSKIGDYIYFYDKQDPVECANIIKAVVINHYDNGRGVVKQLDLQFLNCLNNLLYLLKNNGQ